MLICKSNKLSIQMALWNSVNLAKGDSLILHSRWENHDIIWLHLPKIELYLCPVQKHHRNTYKCVACIQSLYREYVRRGSGSSRRYNFRHPESQMNIHKVNTLILVIYGLAMIPMWHFVFSATRLLAVDNFMVYPNSSKIQLASLTISTIYYFITQYKHNV